MKFKEWKTLTQTLYSYSSVLPTATAEIRYRQSEDNRYIQIILMYFRFAHNTGKQWRAVTTDTRLRIQAGDTVLGEYEDVREYPNNCSSTFINCVGSNIPTLQHTVIDLLEEGAPVLHWYANFTSTDTETAAHMERIRYDYEPTEWHEWNMLEGMDIVNPVKPKEVKPIVETVKRQLGYVWISEEQERTLTDVIEEGLAYLQGYDNTLDIDNIQEDPNPRSLLVNYCRYSIANALDDFPNNYSKEIIKLSNRGRKRRANAKTEEPLD